MDGAKGFNVSADRLTRTMLGAIAGLLAVIAVALWDGRPSLLPAASAQIPDSGRQRQELVREVRRSNELLAQILEHLRTKPVKVQTLDADERTGASPRGAGSTGRKKGHSSGK